MLDCFTDPKSEKLAGDIYMPRDEKFGHLKSSDFLTYGLKSLSQQLLPSLENVFDSDLTWNEFDSFEEVRALHEGGIKLPTDALSDFSPLPVFRELFRSDGENALQLPPPHVVRGTLIPHPSQNNLCLFKLSIFQTFI